MSLDRIRRWWSGYPGSFLGHELEVVWMERKHDSWQPCNARVVCRYCPESWVVWGSSTVWRMVESGERCGFECEAKLGAAWSHARRLLDQRQEAPK